MELRWHERAFDALSARELYAILELRQRVFILEQQCLYADADGLDRVARHLWAERAGELVAYLRILPAGAKYAELSIGRVIAAPAARGSGLGRTLMQRGLAACGGAAVRIGAQAHLERFYGELGFVRVSDDYVEDGIPHVEMLRAAARAGGSAS